MIKKKLQENTKELSQVLRNLLSEYGLDKTLTITGLNIIQLFDRIGPLIINPDLTYDIILELWSKTDLLTREIDDYYLSYDPFEGTIRWVYSNKKTEELMYSICTPYWDAKDWIPINVEQYVKHANEMDVRGEFIIKAPNEFLSLNQIVKWYNDYYIKSVVKVLNQFLEKYRKEFEEY